MTRFPDLLALRRHQLSQLQSLIAALLGSNPFYQRKLSAREAVVSETDLDSTIRDLPFTTKAELVADQQAHPPYGSNLTFPLSHYIRHHQTSGSSGRALRWLDTKDSWDWMLGNWLEIYQAAEITPADRVFFAFSFGPFLGFWTAFEAATRLGCLCMPGGGLSSVARLRTMADLGATVLCCTPTYALHLGATAQLEAASNVPKSLRRIIVAGEPGGSIPSTRRQLEGLWPGARVMDHHGMTEVGPVSFECPEQPLNLHVIESSYIAEVIDPTSGRPVAPNQLGELVLTPLGRVGSPLLRYRTGDLVRRSDNNSCGCGRHTTFAGGILGRTDDMVVIRGVNVYPSAVEDVVRRVGGIAEYQVEVIQAEGLAEIRIRVEPDVGVNDLEALLQQLRDELHHTFALRFEVQATQKGALPRFEMKADRWKKISPTSSPTRTSRLPGTPE